MENTFNKTPRKPDYVTYAALLMFVVVLASELLLVSWLPNKLMDEQIHEKEVAKQGMVDLEDSLRAKVKKLKKIVVTGEVELVGDCLDNIARYLRVNSGKMTRPQVREVMEDLSRFETIVRGWTKGASYVRTEELESASSYISTIESDIRISK